MLINTERQISHWCPWQQWKLAAGVVNTNPLSRFPFSSRYYNYSKFYHCFCPSQILRVSQEHDTGDWKCNCLALLGKELSSLKGKNKEQHSLLTAVEQQSPPKAFSKYIPIPASQHKGFQTTPPVKPLFFLEAFTQKPRLIDSGHETVQAFGFWENRVSNQLSVNRYLLSVITSLLHGATGEDYPFNSPREPGCARYQKISDKYVPGISRLVCAQSHPSCTDKERALHEAEAQSQNQSPLHAFLLSPSTALFQSPPN